MSTDNKERSSILWNLLSFETIAKISFILYLFFIFFGTSLPFKEEKIDVDEYGSNPFRQLVFSSLYFLSFISILPVFQKVFAIIKKEKFLFIFLMWALLSTIWSNYSDVSFKRWMQIFGAFVVCMSAVIYLDSPEKILKYFRLITITYLTLSFVSVIGIPGASMDYQGSRVWRGLAPHKNTLGQIILVCTIITVFSIKYLKTSNRILDLGMFFISILLLMGSRSTTALVALIIVALIAMASDAQWKLGFGALSKWIYYSFLLTLIAFYLSSLIIIPSLTEELFGIFGKDMTFTGRTDLWITLIGITTTSNILIGVGYGGFWVYGSPNLIKLYAIVHDTPIQAHNGYIDITIETGFIGLTMVIIMILWYFYNNRTKTNVNYWKYFIIITLLSNLQESTLFKLNSTTGILFIFSYLLLFSRITLKEKIESKGSNIFRNNYD